GLLWGSVTSPTTSPGVCSSPVASDRFYTLNYDEPTIVTRVEYVKSAGDRTIAVTHAGVQVATRTAYAPQDWPLRILTFDDLGQPKTSAEFVVHDVAGPACFAGDLLARGRLLPPLES